MNIRYAVIATSVLLATPAAQAVQNIDRSLPTGATPSVEISNVQGRVTVTATFASLSTSVSHWLWMS